MASAGRIRGVDVRSRLTLAVSAVLFLSGAGARADDPGALIAEGVRLGKEQRFDAALARFREAIHARATAEGHCFAATAYFRLGRLSQAHLHLARAEALGPTPAWCGGELRRVLQSALERARHVPVAFEVQPAGARVRLAAFEPDEALASPCVMWLPAGTHAYTIEAEGHGAHAGTVVVDGPGRVVRLALRAVERPAVASERPVVPPPAPARSPTPPPVAASSRPALWITAVSGGALLAAGVGMHLVARSTQDAAAHAPTRPVYDAEIASFRTQRAVTLGLYGAGAVLSGVAAYLALRPGAWSSERGVSVAVSPEDGGARLHLATTF